MRLCSLRRCGVAAFVWIALCAPAAHAIETNPAAESAATSLPVHFEFLSVQRALVQTQAGVQCIDARSVSKYLAGHIPGAVSVRDEQLRAHCGPIPTQMLGATELARVFGNAGIDQEKPVIVYSDGEDPLAATFVAYALLKAGHRHVSVLSGGFAAWQGAGPTTQEFPRVVACAWAAPSAELATASLDDIRLVLKRDETALVDARPAKLYRGETKAWQRNGHIPGAISLDWHTLVQPDNESLLKSANDVNKLIESAGLDASNDTIVYCGTGREATLLYLHLKGVLKWPRVRLYEGSWTEYQTDASLPVATGSESRPLVMSDGEVSISGQPTADMVREMADRGFTLLINCRTPSETRKLEFNEASLAQSVGMKYVELPLGGSSGYDAEDVERLDALLREHGARGETAAGGPRVYMHCAGGGRSATLWAAYLVKHRGLSAAEAVERMRAVGLLADSSLERLLETKLLPHAPEK